MSRKTLSAKGTPRFLGRIYSNWYPLCSPRRAFLIRHDIRIGSLTTGSLLRPNDALPALLPSNLIPQSPPPITVVHTPHSTPSVFQKLDQALSKLKKNAAVYINNSQLRLALRGLESADPVTRIAILGLESRQGAARLARTILADPLAEFSAWEKRLQEVGAGDGKALLIRHGEVFKVDDGNPLVETLLIPSSLLRTHKIEILIQRTNVDDRIVNFSNLLVPTLETTGSYGGRYSLVTYPVHKVLAYADTLENLPLIGEAQYLGSMVQRVVNGTWTSLQPIEERASSVTPVNLSLSEKAIGIFRTSVERSTEFEQAWFDSGVSSVASWLPEGTNTSSEALKPSLRRLITVLLSDTARAIQAEEDTELKESKASEVSTATRNLIAEGITSWAENAHTELRDRLNSAFLSKSWGKTKWWKLFWRVDEVGFIALNILNRAWLVDAEKEMIWVSGRIQQAGLLGPLKRKTTTKAPAADNMDKDIFGDTRKHRLSDVMDEAKPIEPDEEEPMLPHPWPQDLSAARAVLSRVTVPPFHALSQTLMLQTVSTTFLTSALSTLIYIGVSSTTIYEAGAIAALGLVLSLRRLQKNWEGAREGWKRTVRDEGAEELRSVEQLLRDAVKNGGEVKFDFAAERRRRTAREALGEVQNALDEIPAKEK